LRACVSSSGGATSCRPLVPLNVQNAVLARIVAVLDGVASYSAARDRANRKRKQALRASTKDERLAKRRKTEPRADDGSDENMEDPQPSTGSRVVQDSPLDRDTFIPDATTGPNAASTDVGQPPAVLQRMYVGINEVTKRLEFQAGAMRRALVVRPDGTEPPLQPLHPISLVLVCVSDVNPPLLTAHVPFLVASCNSGRPGAGVPSVKLVPLPKGAEAVLAEATGLRRASIIAFEASSPSLVFRHGLTANAVEWCHKPGAVGQLVGGGADRRCAMAGTARWKVGHEQ
jgi:ribonuclease P/MRP protein subunit POP3